MKNNIYSLNTTSDSQCKYNGTFWNMITGTGGSCDVPPGYNKNTCTLIGDTCYSNTAPQCKSSDECYFDWWEYRCANKDPSKGSLGCKRKNSWWPDCECTTINPNIHPINFPSPHPINPNIHPIDNPCSSNIWTEECKNKIMNMIKIKYGVRDQNILNCCMEYLTKKTTPNNIPDYILDYAVYYCQPCDKVWTQWCISRMVNYISTYRKGISGKALICSINLITSSMIPSSVDENISIVNDYIDNCADNYP